MTVALNYRKDHVIINPYSRPGHPLLDVQAVVDHYTANRHANAEDHQEYFDGADGGGGRYAGAHIFVDKHEAVEVIPLNEVAYHANEHEPLLPTLKASSPYYPGGNANLLTIGVEMCIEEDGSFHPDTVERTRLVMKMLQKKFPQLRDTKNRIVRHYDVTGKICPKPFVDSKKAWNNFLDSIDEPVVGIAKVPEKPKTNEGVEYMNPSNQAIANSVAVVLNRLENKEGGISSQWREDFLNGKLTTSDAIGLLYVALDRGLIQGEE